MHISLDSLMQRKVLDAAGHAIGEVEALLFDSTSWHVAIIRVLLRRDVAEQAGVHASVFKKAHIDIPTTMVQSVGDVVLLSVNVESLQGLSHPQHDAPAP